MNIYMSRRLFLESSAIFLGGFFTSMLPRCPLPEECQGIQNIGRVTIDYINIYEHPDFRSNRIARFNRDELIWLYEELESPHGPTYNPKWYKISNGYAHSGYLQPVEIHGDNPPLHSIPKFGILGKVTVPYISSYRFSRVEGWRPLYRLYYDSIHWISGIDEGPDKKPWYRITDHRITEDYHVPAHQIFPISTNEYLPLSPHIPPENKYIEISIDTQILRAFENNSQIREFRVSTGIHSKHQKDGEIPTDTPTGIFQIQTKMPSRHMGDGNLTSDYHAYELPGVPWTMIFHETGAALHGTYWHNNFGVRMSHGCVNMRNIDAKWLFQWTYPIFSPRDYYEREAGTLIRIV